MGDDLEQDDTARLVGQIIEGLDPGAFVTKYVVVAEAIDTEGQRAVWSQASDDATRWDTYGLLTEALQTEKAAHIAERMDDS